MQLAEFEQESNAERSRAGSGAGASGTLTRITGWGSSGAQLNFGVCDVVVAPFDLNGQITHAAASSSSNRADNCGTAPQEITNSKSHVKHTVRRQ